VVVMVAHRARQTAHGGVPAAHLLALPPEAGDIVSSLSYPHTQAGKWVAVKESDQSTTTTV